MIGDDFEVQADGDIRHVAGTGTYTVLQLHRWLQDLADNAAASGDDLLDITSVTPSERSTDNIVTLNAPFNIDLIAAEYLYDGSVLQKAGDEQFSGLVIVGSVYSPTTLQVVQNNGLYDGDVPFWGQGINADEAQNILCRMLIRTKVSGSAIDGQRVRVYARELGDTYAEFSVTMGLGNSVAAIFSNQDLNNQTPAGTIAGWNTITNVEGYQTIDLNNGNGARPYYSQWNRDTFTINQLYERTKWLTRRGTASAIHSMDGELFRGITHEIAYISEAGGPFVEDAIISWGASGTAGTAALLALLDQGTSGSVWVQLLTGVPPTPGLQLNSGGTTANVNGSPVSRTLSAAFLGISTGASLIGAYGIGVESADLTNADKLFDLTNTLQQPPNNVTFTVGGLVTAEDYVLVGPKAGGSDFDFAQRLLSVALNGAAETAVVVTVAIPSDTPLTGTIRIELNSGKKRRVAYTSWAGSTFTIASTNFTADPASAGNDVMISYIDVLCDAGSEAFTVVYSGSPRDLWIRVRDGGGTPIKTFETAGVLGSAGGSVTAIRTTDA